MEESWEKNAFIISTDKNKLQVDAIYRFIKASYWGKSRTMEQMQTSIQHSYCFGMYHEDKQIGFARVITDNCLLAYLADVYIETDYQQRGLGKWLIDVILNSKNLKDVKTWMLLTNDAHGLYEQFGFQLYAHPQKIMRLDKKAYSR